MKVKFYEAVPRTPKNVFMTPTYRAGKVLHATHLDPAVFKVAGYVTLPGDKRRWSCQQAELAFTAAGAPYLKVLLVESR